jgi:hypothetical protein
MNVNEKCREDMDFFIQVFKEVVKLNAFDIINELYKHPDIYEVAKDTTKEDLLDYIENCYPTRDILDTLFLKSVTEAFLEEVRIWSDDDENEYVREYLLETYYDKVELIEKAIGDGYESIVVDPNEYIQSEWHDVCNLEDIGVETWDILVGNETYKVEFLNK